MPQATITDPLARVPLSHTQYTYNPNPNIPNQPNFVNQFNTSPTCVTSDLTQYPSWVDSKNPPQWYNDGADIDTLLEDADCLNWLSDTGDLNEDQFVMQPIPIPGCLPSSNPLEQHQGIADTVTSCGNPMVDLQGHLEFVPSQNVYSAPIAPMAQMEFVIPTPTHVTSNGMHAPIAPMARPPSFTNSMEPACVNVKMEDMVANIAAVQDPTAVMGVHHHTLEMNIANMDGGDLGSAESLSFLVDSHEGHEQQDLHDGSSKDVPTHYYEQTMESNPHAYASATEAIEAHGNIMHEDDGMGDKLGFPDLDMGDEQAFVSALLENSGQSSISFPKLNSDSVSHFDRRNSDAGSHFQMSSAALGLASATSLAAASVGGLAGGAGDESNSRLVGEYSA